MNAHRFAKLDACWQRTWQELGVAPPAGDLVALVARYSEPGRHYHTTQHLEECLAAFDALRETAAHAGEAELALWFHDAVYVPGESGNESRSALLAVEALRDAGAPKPVRDRVHELVLATRHVAAHCHGDAACVVDADLCILSAEPARFDEYERQVRREYGWLEETLFRDGRVVVLGRLLERDWIYCTPEFRARREGRARENLQRSLARLRAGTG